MMKDLVQSSRVNMLYTPGSKPHSDRLTKCKNKQVQHMSEELMEKKVKGHIVDRHILHVSVHATNMHNTIRM
ncbi:MAG: hypothetical protein P857_819 [Candidatus Xenolissoclinum pacificiensis L6]|uniref:Uncharacterized protein n=1 Tax=Candidatus Xenolissoclinum pacificiensis L6 TaxID=1401685 RepID=W2V082_9RICK|nr:MAG: hypothetical protein P857_819 [Candidatus Xenolissoclinum pacificiensis L6]